VGVRLVGVRHEAVVDVQRIRVHEHARHAIRRRVDGLGETLRERPCHSAITLVIRLRNNHVSIRLDYFMYKPLTMFLPSVSELVFQCYIHNWNSKQGVVFWCHLFLLLCVVFCLLSFFAYFFCVLSSATSQEFHCSEWPRVMMYMRQ